MSKIQMRHFESFSNNVSARKSAILANLAILSFRGIQRCSKFIYKLIYQYWQKVKVGCSLCWQRALKSIFSIKCVSFPFLVTGLVLDLQFLLKGSKKDSFRSFLYFAELNCFLLCSSTKPLDHVPTLQTTLWTTQLRASASNMRFEGHKKGQKTNKLRSCCQNVNQ